MKVKNRSVASSWSAGIAANSHTGNFWTDGTKLYSYKLLIGDTTLDGVKVLRDHTARGRWNYHSQTTSCHVGYARPFADILD